MPNLIVYTNPLTPGICQMPVYTVGDDPNWAFQFSDGTTLYNPTNVSINIGFIRGLSDVAYASAFQLVDRTNSIYTGSVTLAAGLPGALTWDENPTAVFGSNGAYLVKGRLPISQIRKVYVVAGGSGLSTAPTVRFNGGVGSNTGYGGIVTAAISAGGLGALTITNNGNHYALFPELLVSGDGTGGTASVSTLTNGKLVVVGSTTAGSGYTAATIQVVDPEATATATVSASSGVTTIMLASGGGGYTSAPTIAITGGGGTSATATSALLNSTWGVRSLTLTNAGSLYTSTPTVSFSGGTGSGVVAYAVASLPDQVFGIAVTSPIDHGYGYGGVPPTITLTGGGGSGATAIPVMDVFNVFVQQIVVTNGGSGYTSAPTVSFSATPSGNAGATATASLGDGTIKSLVVTNTGSGYGATAPTVAFSGGGGSGAAATAVLIGSPISPVITITAAGSGYTSAPVVGFSGGSGTGAAATTGLSLGVTAITMLQGGYAYSTIPDVFLEPVAGSSAGAVLQAAGPLAHSVPFVQGFNPPTNIGAITCTPFTSGRRDSSGNLIYDDALLIVRPRYLVQPALTLRGDNVTWAGVFNPVTTMVQAVLQYRRSFTADVEIFGGGRLLFIGSLTIAAA